MKRSRFGSRIAVAVVAALTATALPVAVLAHPSSYDSPAKVVPDNPPSPLAYEDLEDQMRYIVCNHGYCWVLEETNGRTTLGVVDYKRVPGDWRSQPSVSTEELLARGAGGAQPHHTCETPALTATSAITGWQDSSDEGKPEPFYGYVPFQKAEFGLDDDPAGWIPHVETLTGVDLSTVSNDPEVALGELEALCESLPGPGVFVPGDEVNTPSDSFNGSEIAEAQEPLLRQVSKLKARNRDKTQKIEAQKKTIKNLRKKIAKLR